MTKQEAVTEFIKEIERNCLNVIIVIDTEGDFHVQSKPFNADKVVYSYGGFVNSSANLEVEDIIKRF